MLCTLHVCTQIYIIIILIIIIVIIIIIISILDKCTALWGKPSNAMHVQMLWQP